MAVNIGPKIGIDGESEFREQINNIVQSQKTLQSEMKAVTAEFDDNADSQQKLTRQYDILNKQIDKQKQRIKLLEKGLDDCASKYGEADTKTQKWQQAVYDATADLSKMQSELKDVESQMNETNSETDELSDTFDEVGDAVDSSGDGFTVMKGALADLVSGGISGAIDTVKEFAESIVNLAEETEEYRTMQAKLSGSAESFGYSVEFAKNQYKEFYEYLGDDQMSTNAITNLMGMQVSTETVTASAEAAIAVWTAYGDSIPIESLTESINESAQVAQVTGVLADALNWAGISEDEFNLKLQALTSTQERADLIAQTLNDTYGQSKATYDEMTEGIRNANSAEAEFKETQAEVGEAVEPVREALTRLKTNGLEAILPVVEKVGDLFESFEEHLSDTGSEINNVISDSKKLRKSMKETVGDLEDSSDALKEVMDEMENSGKTTDYFVDSLEKLAETSDKTADQQRELEAIVAYLNKAFPNLSLSVDATTGSLNKSAEEVRKFVQEAKNTELAVEAQGKYEEAVKNLTAAEEARTAAQEALNTVTADRMAKEAEIQAMLDVQTQKENAYVEAQNRYQEAIRTGIGDLEALRAATLDTSEATYEYNGRVMTVSEALMLARQDLTNLVTEEEKHKDVLLAQDEKLAQSKAVMDEYSASLSNNAAAAGKVSEASAGYQIATQAAITDVGRAMEAFNNLTTSQQETALALEESVTAMQESLSQTIQSQMDMFSQFDSAIDLTTQDLLTNMQSQVDGVTQWGENITALSDTAINKNLLQYLMDMGPDGAGYVQLFTEMSADELAQANTLWEEALDIQGLTTEWGEELSTIGAENIASGMDGIKDLMQESGADTVMGLVEGIRNAKGEAEQTGKELGDDTIDSVDEGLGVSSPSRKTRESGQYVDQGLIDGIKAYQPKVQQTAREMAQKTIQTIGQETGATSGASPKTKNFGTGVGRGLQTGITSTRSSVMNAAKSVAQGAITSMRNGLNNGKSSVVNAARSVSQSAISAMKSAAPSSSMYSTGYNVAAGLANGIYAGRSAVINAAASVAASAIAAAQSALQIHSPSRVFWDMGDNAVNAFASGFADSEKKVAGEVASTLQFSARNAMDYTGRASNYENIADSVYKAISAAYKAEKEIGDTTIVVDGDTIVLDGKAIGKSAQKYITGTQISRAASKGRRLGIV